MDGERYHYRECGLEDVYLVNGFTRFKSARGTSVAIKNIDMLHQAIGTHLCNQTGELSGREIKFLRRELMLSQAALAHLVGVKEQTVHRWEADKNSMPRATEALLRRLYMEQVESDNDSLRDLLKRIADLEDAIHHRQELIFKLKTTRRRKTSAGQQAAQWALAA